MENNNRETKDYQQPISPLEYLNKRKEKKEKRKYGFTSDYSGRPGPLSLCQHAMEALRKVRDTSESINANISVLA